MVTNSILDFEEVVKFHGHVCPGLAMGYRAAELAVSELKLDSDNDDIFAVVENKSCAVDAIQVITGCTYGKGNLIVNDLGKQVYSVARRPSGEGVRIAVRWLPPAEKQEDSMLWDKFMKGDRSDDVMSAVNRRKAEKVKAIFAASFEELFEVTHQKVSLPERAQVYPTKTCDFCGDKVMEPKTVRTESGQCLCIPCSKKGN